jgi:hypothetical protein
MEQHRKNPVCASCHARMDPLGFALENFDAVGAWRARSESGAPLDTADVMADGTRIDGIAGLRAALTANPDLFVRTFVEKLFVYALGRGLEPADMPAVRGVVRDARASGYRFSSIATGLARSVLFRMRSAARPEGTLQTATVTSAR